MSWVGVAIGGVVLGGALKGAGTIIGADASATARVQEADAKAMGSLYAATQGVEGAKFKAAALEQGGLFAEQTGAYEATQLRQDAIETRAAAQREAYEKRHVGKLALSTLIARAASSGGGTGGNVTKLAERIAERSEYLALSEMFSGESRARRMEDQATATMISAAAKKYGANVDAISTRYGADVGLNASIFEGQAMSRGARTAAKGERMGGYLSGAGSILSGIGSGAALKKA